MGTLVAVVLQEAADVQEAAQRHPHVAESYVCARKSEITSRARIELQDQCEMQRRLRCARANAMSKAQAQRDAQARMRCARARLSAMRKGEAQCDVQGRVQAPYTKW